MKKIEESHMRLYKKKFRYSWLFFVLITFCFSCRGEETQSASRNSSKIAQKISIHDYLDRKPSLASYPPTYWPSSHGKSVQWVKENYFVPSKFIQQHRKTPLSS